MAKNDYFVMAYKLLKYLYDCLKHGQAADLRLIQCESKYFPVDENYFNYLLVNLASDGYITGVTPVPMMNETYPGAKVTSEIMITPRGIEYLQENNKMKKVMETLQDVKDLIPCI